MTANQINRMRVLEDQRHNLATEGLTERELNQKLDELMLRMAQAGMRDLPARYDDAYTRSQMDWASQLVNGWFNTSGNVMKGIGGILR